MSYSYYLIHGVALKAAFQVLAKGLPGDTAWDGMFFGGMIVVMFGLTIVPGIFLFAFVERPLSLMVPSRPPRNSE